MKIFLLIVRFIVSLVFSPLLAILFVLDCVVLSMFGLFTVIAIFKAIGELAQWFFSLFFYENRHEIDWDPFLIIIAPIPLLYLRWKGFVFDEILMLYPDEDNYVEPRINWSQYKTRTDA